MASAAQMAEQPNPANRPRNATEFFSSHGKRTAVFSLLLVLLTLIAYNPVTKNGFVSFDDPDYITANQHVQAGLTWNTVQWAFRSMEHANWHPLTWLSHALDYQVFHLRAAGHHYSGVLLHAMTAVLLFLFLQAVTGFAGRSLAVATLFAIHPLNVESVAWAAERKNVLSMLFFVLMLIAYRQYAKQPDWRRYGLVALLFALGLMAKPMLVTAPFLLLLVDYWPLERTKTVSARQLIGEKLPLLAMSAASSVVTMIAQKNSGAVHTADYSLANRILNAVVSYMRYMEKLIWPSPLAAFYPHPTHLPVWQWGLSLVILLGISACVVVRRDKRYLATGWLWFLGAMIPVIGIVQVGEQAMADRHAYLPFVGLFVAGIWGIADWGQAKRISALYLAGAMCLAVGALAMTTRHQIGYWSDTKTLWTHTLAVTGPNFVAEDSLGAELIDEGNLQAAKQHLARAVEINPRDAFGTLDLGVCEKKSGNLEKAIADYQAALQLSSERNLRATAYGNLGSIYRVRGDYVRAQANYDQALQLLPDYTLALTGMGLIAEKNGDANVAANYFAHAVSSAPSDSAYLLLAQALAKAGQPREAQAALTKAQSMSTNWSATLGAVNHLLQE